MTIDSRAVFRFAPSPNGWLHLGHALSAILNFEAAERAGGRFLLRIEDIDAARAREEFVAGIFDDLRWLGLAWEEPVRRQSQHMADYAGALARLKGGGCVYPCVCTRSDIAQAVAEKERASGSLWTRDPDGAPLYPGTCRTRPRSEIGARLARGDGGAWRLDHARAAQLASGALTWTEIDSVGAPAAVPVDPALWGDVIVARRDIGTSYHVAVVVDDALQGVTHVIRGRDLYHATGVQRLLQELLGLPAPLYAHHRLVLDDSGAKLSKSLGAASLRDLRAGGATPADIRRMIGLPPRPQN
ncbi:MAG: tRNA glutamyl-Q(34) synthetase GluQRS [Rhizobiales bacterium 65-9]|nr:tRNA glutamyl-Q(34) synthetase GluQRS [Hyphomicrobiales bacterium]OJY37383.1 MAG: tRNA glutamyl-Q(34) synthetase GluQRS [Rhizobiales bacterium 65-9]